ncbi:MAG: phenylalanine--tRNA ligase subunit beta [Chthoniobacterales bacterium]|nr:phenylalanine--tRNA ligase subunit beta [Chthoniobacterales bacterium]
MKISLSWLAEYADLPESADALADLLTAGGTEVVGRMVRGEVPDNVVVAQILSSEQHPNADRLSVCRVDDGSGQPRQIVCGAKNYKVGDKVPLALPGAVLGPDFKIKSGKLRGVVSDGMMCSAKELGLAEDAEGLLILPHDAPVGKAMKDLVRPDAVLELEVTPNRPDLLCYRGVAREIAALSNAQLRMAPLLIPPVKPAGSTVRLENDGCPYYTARVIRGVKIGPSPQWLADRLASAGLRPINNIVDVTNYVLLETGQPLHAFDLGKLSGAIVVRNAAPGEKLKTLDGGEILLRDTDLVIADQGKPVALAGAIGGLETGVTEATTDILLESAWFQPARIRKTARELGLQTDSSYRFERRVDPAGVLAASCRAVELIISLAGGSADTDTLVAGDDPSPVRVISFDPARCRALLGAEIADAEMDAIFHRLGLVKSSAGWTIPSFRPDLARPVDLAEEVIRVAGIERVPSRLRGFPAPMSGADLRHDNAERLRERLRAQGFSEARTSHFVSPEGLQRAGVAAEGAVRIANPLGADQALLRPVLLPGLLEALARNMRHGAGSVRLFELGTVFQLTGVEERTALALVCTGQGSDLFDLKGAIREALGDVEFAPETGLALRVSARGVDGFIRRLPRVLAESHDAKEAVHYAELVIDGWLQSAVPAIRVRPLPRFPAVERDLSLLLPRATPYAAIDRALVGAKAPHLQSVGLKDVFVDQSGAKLAPDLRSVTVTLTFRDEARTLTSDEVDRAVETLRDHAKAELGAVFRG